MILTEQLELKRIVEALENLDALYEGDNEDQDSLLQHHPDFKKLQELAYKERFPQTQPNTVTSLTWDELISMRDEAVNCVKHYDSELRHSNERHEVATNSKQKALFKQSGKAIDTEIERRLLALIPTQEN